MIRPEAVVIISARGVFPQTENFPFAKTLTLQIISDSQTTFKTLLERSPFRTNVSGFFVIYCSFLVDCTWGQLQDCRKPCLINISRLLKININASRSLLRRGFPVKWKKYLLFTSRKFEMTHFLYTTGYEMRGVTLGPFHTFHF